ncbi:MarR family winged helix-turn-helix transcriptional regulator [Tropicimonas sediminicola]|uniref:DNA-binding transcriptional regulator, MarR family n=1 Tax=Tropicimonas sediminicola TaxID=1031541 RepID=A0A239KWC8_9RHOB|nr:MarR family winged helix-turn-helix transcriptional regulator [Tropicimonas sediminicola]SNT21819.1 DNA-binding transcriptional regulator, MarR family [Tropicimonas sediminicola]
MSDFDLDSFLPYRLAVLAGQVSREFSRRYNERFGISRPEWRVVAHLAQSGPASVGEIHQRVDMDKSRVSRAATRLEQAGYIRKDAHPTDGRLVTLRLTQAGRAMMQELSEMARAYQAELTERLGPQAEQLDLAMQKLYVSED